MHEDNEGEGGRERDERCILLKPGCTPHPPSSFPPQATHEHVFVSLAILVTPVLQNLGTVAAVFFAAVRRGLKLRFLIAPRRSYYLLIRSFWDQHQTQQQ